MKRTALVTGAASGIGESCALQLASEDYDLLLWDIDVGGLERVGKQIKQESPSCNITTATVDVGNLKTMEQAASDAKAGGVTVSHVVANAGIARLDSLLRPDPEAAALSWSVNFHGIKGTLELFAKDMVDHQGSAVVIGSTESFTGGGPLSSYASTKHAVLGLARSAAIELGPMGVRINTVCPGPIKTPMYQPEAMGPEAMEVDRSLRARIPLKRLGRADEIGAVVVFLLSDKASFVNGAAIVADGGLTC